ncbi:MAG: hypothetical protein SGARI_007624, partial [Bacillariaceae sp.]
PKICLKEAPAYSFQPELIQKLINEPLKPEQMASQKVVERFLKVKRDLIERSQRRREQRSKLTRSRRGAVLQAPPLLRNDLHRSENTSSQHFHSVKENQRGSGMGLCMPESPILNRDWNVTHHSSGENLQHNQHNAMNSSYLPINQGPSGHDFFTPPASPNAQRAQAAGQNPSPSSMDANDIEPPVSLDDLTEYGDGLEWTCVFSGVAQSGFDFDDFSFEEHFQRLLGYRLQFDGARTVAISGEQARMLPPVDEKTRMANGLKTMEGILERKDNTYS